MKWKSFIRLTKIQYSPTALRMYPLLVVTALVSKITHPHNCVYTSEFESHWVPLSYGLVPHLSKKKSLVNFHPHNCVKRIYEEWDIPINVHL